MNKTFSSSFQIPNLNKLCQNMSNFGRDNGDNKVFESMLNYVSELQDTISELYDIVMNSSEILIEKKKKKLYKISNIENVNRQFTKLN